MFTASLWILCQSRKRRSACLSLAARVIVTHLVGIDLLGHDSGASIQLRYPIGSRANAHLAKFARKKLQGGLGLRKLLPGAVKKNPWLNVLKTANLRCNHVGALSLLLPFCQLCLSGPLCAATCIYLYTPERPEHLNIACGPTFAVHSPPPPPR